jgi:hypothetical protein
VVALFQTTLLYHFDMKTETFYSPQGREIVIVFDGENFMFYHGDLIRRFIDKAYKIQVLYQLCGLEELDSDQTPEKTRLTNLLPKF